MRGSSRVPPLADWVTCAPTTVSIGGEDVVVSGAATRSMCQVSVSLTGYTFGVIYLTSVVALLFFILSIGSLGRRVRLCGAYVARHPTPTEHSVTVPLLAAGSWPGTASAGKRREGEEGVHSSEQGESPQKGGSSFVPAGSRAFAALLVGTLMLGTVMIQFGMLLASGGTKPHFVCAVTGNATLPGAGQYFSLNAEGICDDVVRPLTAKDVLQGGSTLSCWSMARSARMRPGSSAPWTAAASAPRGYPPSSSTSPSLKS